MKQSAPPATAAAMLALLAACASTPEASPEMDREAKRFGTHPDSSTLYVYRTDLPSPGDDSVLWINGRLIGATLPRTFFQVHLNPGTHRLAGYGVDNGMLAIPAPEKLISSVCRFWPAIPGLRRWILTGPGVNCPPAAPCSRIGAPDSAPCSDRPNPR